MDFATLGAVLSVWFLPVIIAITFHEAAHAWVADLRGDPTARLLGRVTFNPIRHVDPIGTLLLPGGLFLVGSPFIVGFAKPVPVNFHRLYNPKRDMILVAIAGPAINVALALVAALSLHLVSPSAEGSVIAWIDANLQNAIFANVVFAVFNMLPIPPLDGGRVLTGLLPRPLDWHFAKVERYGFVILLALLLSSVFAGDLGLPFVPLEAILWPPINGLLDLVLILTGLAH
ncbi:MAG: site-2 protease family protein [Alphaproteobacteria bacterium]